MNSSLGHKKNRGASAVSPAIAHVILAATIVSLGMAVLLWSSGTFNAHQSEASTFFSTSTEDMKECLVIEDIWFYEGDDKYVNVTVRNVGMVGLEIAAIHVDGEKVWDDNQWVEIGKAVTIKIAFSWDVGEHYIVVTTTRGNQVKEWYNISA